jgi:hypothetical protein
MEELLVALLKGLELLADAYAAVRERFSDDGEDGQDRASSDE